MTKQTLQQRLNAAKKNWVEADQRILWSRRRAESPTATKEEKRLLAKALKQRDEAIAEIDAIEEQL